MPINICKRPGYLGGLSIEPQTITVTKSEIIEYTISLNTREILPELDGEFRIDDSDFTETVDFKFIFDEADKINNSIKLNKNGFNFRFTSSDATIKFKLEVNNFFNRYEAALVVDAITSGYGDAVASLNVEPEFQIIQADNYSEYPPEIQIPPETTEPPVIKIPEKTIKFPEINENFLLINEYNYYSKDYELSSTTETSLLNINKNFNSIDIRRYYSGKQFGKPVSKILLHSYVYMKELYPKFDKQKFLCPMYVEIKFLCDETKTQLTTFLESIGMLDYFCYFYIFNNTNKNINVLNLRNAIENQNLNQTDLQITDKYSGKLSNIKNYSTNSFQKTILLKILDKQFQNLSSIYKNQILMYKISKLKGNQLINDQYFINRFQDKELVYFDTQLKYDTEYEYKAYKIEVLADGTMSETLIEDYQSIIRIIDSPPLPPDILYIPFKGTDNQIMINFNSSAGRYEDYPIIIKNEDKTVFNKIFDNSFYNRINNQENKIQFESDDFFGTFEIYRLETAPKKYEDFENGKFIETNFTSLLDNIVPNKKYYYVARTRDIHGNLSNPTKPIELQMINENGTIFLLKKEYSFTEEHKIISKNINSFIQLSPAKQHLQINREKSYDVKPDAKSAKEINLVLGNKDVSVWNKQFLMRVASKHTGKKIDIKFKFSYSNPK